MEEIIVQKVRVGGTQQGKVMNLVVTVPMNKGIKEGDYVRIVKVDL